MDSNWRSAKPPETEFDLVPAVVDPKDDRKFGFGRSKRGARSKKAGGGRVRHRGNKSKNSGRGKNRERNIQSMPERIHNKKQSTTSSDQTTADAPSSCDVTERSDDSILDSKEVQNANDVGEFVENPDWPNFEAGEPEFYPPEHELEYLPAQPPVFLNPETIKKRAAEQLSYYFSVENLCKDVYLRQYMDVEGYIPLSIVGQFKRMQQITMPQINSFDLVLDLLRDIACEAELLDFDVINDKVRLKENWKAWLWPSADGSMGVPLWTKLQDDMPIEPDQRGSGDDEITEVALTASSKPFVPSFSS